MSKGYIGSNNKILVILVLGENDENRENIYDKNYATFYTSEFKIIDIYEPDTKKNKELENIIDKTEYFNAKDNLIFRYQNSYFNHIKVKYYLTEERAKYDCDIKFDTTLFFYKNGCKKSLIFQVFEKAKEIINWYDNGMIKAKSEIIDDIEDFVEYYQNGQIKSCGQLNIKNNYGGISFGNYKKWYENGNLESHEKYNNQGKKEGEQKFWHENGQISMHYFCQNGKDEGMYNSWYKNGRLKYEISFKDGKYDGIYNYYYDNGNKKQESIFCQGNKIGQEIQYHEDGNIFMIFKFGENGLLDGESKIYDKKGRIKNIDNYKNDKKDGKCIYYQYDENGKVYEHITDYIDGIKVKTL